MQITFFGKLFTNNVGASNDILAELNDLAELMEA